MKHLIFQEYPLKAPKIRVFPLIVLAALLIGGCQAAPTPAAQPTDAPTAAPEIEMTTTESGLQYVELKAGSGPRPQPGQLATMHYIASLPDGTVLIDTFQRGQSATAMLGVGQLLPGWEEALLMMKVGERAKFILPPELAFGAEGNGPIPPNSKLVLEIELLEVKDPPIPAAFEEGDLTTTESGLQFLDLADGSGAEALEKYSVSTAYTLWLKTENGYQYIGASEEGQPVQFVLGSGNAPFAGWEEGVRGMKVGGRRLLIVPPALGLGDTPYNDIPANSTLVLEIDLLAASEPRLPTQVDPAKLVTTASGLKYADLQEGSGASPQKGQTVVVHYTGWLEDGTIFDSSLDRSDPIRFTFGTGAVIAGWDEGLATMKVGGKRQLIIPPALGYGDSGQGSIPGGATLIFEVELLEIVK